jgi:RNA-directed DNA polymerase
MSLSTAGAGGKRTWYVQELRNGLVSVAWSCIRKRRSSSTARTRTGWKLHLRTAQSIAELAREINPKLRGWLNYYGRFHPSAFRAIERHVGQSLVRWACRKYKTLRHHRTRAWEWLLRVV